MKLSVNIIFTCLTGIRGPPGHQGPPGAVGPKGETARISPDNFVPSKFYAMLCDLNTITYCHD